MWKPALLPLLADFSGWAFFIGTPKGRGPFYKLRNQALEEDRWEVFEFKASKTGYLTKDELDLQKEILGQEMYEQEYECNFDAQVEGAVYHRAIRELEESGRVCSVPHNPNKPVFTAWDLGSASPCTVWFFQLDGPVVNFIDHYEKREHGIHRSVLDIQNRTGNSGAVYKYAIHYLPWDAESKTDMAYRNPNTQPFLEARRDGVLSGSIRVMEKKGVLQGITAVQALLPKCYFDKKRCGDGVDKLSMYRYDVDSTNEVFKRNPIYNWTSHTADAMRIAALAMPKNPALMTKAQSNDAWSGTTLPPSKTNTAVNDPYRPGLLGRVARG